VTPLRPALYGQQRARAMRRSTRPSARLTRYTAVAVLTLAIRAVGARKECGPRGATKPCVVRWVALLTHATWGIRRCSSWRPAAVAAADMGMSQMVRTAFPVPVGPTYVRRQHRRNAEHKDMSAMDHHLHRYTPTARVTERGLSGLAGLGAFRTCR